MNKTINFLDKLDFALAGAVGYAISLGKYSHALIFCTCSILIAIVEHRIITKNASKDPEGE